MEWTQEKIERLQGQFKKKYEDFKSKHWNFDPAWESSRDLKKLWVEFIEALGVNVRTGAFETHHYRAFGWEEPYLHNDGNLCLIDPSSTPCASRPFNSFDMLVVSQETAERILIMGL